MIWSSLGKKAWYGQQLSPIGPGWGHLNSSGRRKMAKVSWGLHGQQKNSVAGDLCCSTGMADHGTRCEVAVLSSGESSHVTVVAD